MLGEVPAMIRSRITPLLAVVLLFVSAAAAHDLVEESDQIAELIGLQPGMHLADVGAGAGEFSEELARRLEGSGHVYASEVDDGELIKIRERLEESELANMTVVEGATDDTNLPEACCEVLLLRYVFHHMSNPEEMRSSLHRSLRPGGLLLVIERDEPGHGITADELIDDLQRDGFEVVSRHPEWGEHDGNYGVLFRRD